MNPYIVCSGYHKNRDDKRYDHFFQTWLNNVCALTPQPQRIIIICDSGAKPPLADCHWDIRVPITVIHLFGDLGSCGALLNGTKDYAFSGWTGVVLAGALLAYTNESDVIFVEEDCLCFGDVVGQMDREIGNAGIIFGNCSFMPCEQSLFLVRHFYIPEFVRLFLGEGPQTNKENLGENIFDRLEKLHPTMWKRFSFGFGRDRPLKMDEPTWYAQKFTASELQQLKIRGMT